jgi:hypothetical protein
VADQLFVRNFRALIREERSMTDIDLARTIYNLPGITSDDRVELVSMFHLRAHNLGVHKQEAAGTDAIERLFRKYEHNNRRGAIEVRFDIRYIAATVKTAGAARRARLARLTCSRRDSARRFDRGTDWSGTIVQCFRRHQWAYVQLH